MRTQSGSTGHLLFKLVAMVVLLGVAANAYSSPGFLAWNFSGNAGNEPTVNATYVNSLLQTTAITRSDGLGPVAVLNTFSATNWTTSLSIDASLYFQFSIDPLPGNKYSITRIDFNFQTLDGSGGGPMKWALRSSVDSYAADLTNWNNGGLSSYSGTVELQYDPNFQNTTVARTFRLYGFNSSGTFYSGGLGGVGTGIVFTGTSAIPEPTSWVLLGTGALVFSLLRRRAQS